MENFIACMIGLGFCFFMLAVNALAWMAVYNIALEWRDKRIKAKESSEKNLY